MIVLTLRSRNAKHSQSLKRKAHKEETGGIKVEETREATTGAMAIIPDLVAEVIKTEAQEADTEAATASSRVTEETIMIEMADLQVAGAAAEEAKYGPTETMTMTTIMATIIRAGVVTPIATQEEIKATVAAKEDMITILTPASPNDQMSDQKQPPRPQALLDPMFQ